MEQNVPAAIPPVEPPQPPKSNKSLIVLLSVLLLFSISTSIFFALQTQKLTKQLVQMQTQVQVQPTPAPTENPTNQDIYQGKYFSISKSTKWEFVSDENQSPATPEVLETVTFANNKAILNVQVGTDSVGKVLASQEGEIVGQILLGGITATKKSGYGGLAGSVYSVNVVASQNSKTYLIGFYTQDTQNISSYQIDFDQILSTFKFTE